MLAILVSSVKLGRALTSGCTVYYISTSLWLAKRGHLSKKCTVDSIPDWHMHKLLGVSKKSCLNSWALTELRLPLSWYKYLRFLLWILKILFSPSTIYPANTDLNADNWSVCRSAAHFRCLLKVGLGQLSIGLLVYAWYVPSETSSQVKGSQPISSFNLSHFIPFQAPFTTRPAWAWRLPSLSIW